MLGNVHSNIDDRATIPNFICDLAAIMADTTKFDRNEIVQQGFCIEIVIANRPVTPPTERLGERSPDPHLYLFANTAKVEGKMVEPPSVTIVKANCTA